MKSRGPVPLVEVIEECNPYTDGAVKFKGKLLHPEVITVSHYEYVEVAMPAEIIFDFNAGELPDLMSLAVSLTEGECLGLLNSVSLMRRTRYAEMEFCFTINDEKPPISDINPYVTLPALVRAIEKEGNKNAHESDPYGYYYIFRIPFSNNVYSHYKKHLADFEKLCKPIESEVIKRLNKKLKI